MYPLSIFTFSKLFYVIHAWVAWGKTHSSDVYNLETTHFSDLKKGIYHVLSDIFNDVKTRCAYNTC
jgi:hypothetical protein